MDGFFSTICAPGTGTCDQVGIWVAALLTILVFSYLLRDTFLFRLAQSILVGVAVGYGSAVILRTVLWDQLVAPLLGGVLTLWANTWELFVPLCLGLLLLTKLIPGWSAIGNISLGYLFGVGSALAIGGALAGVLAPQLGASMLSLSPAVGPLTWVNNLLIVVGVIGVLFVFRFSPNLGAARLHAYATIVAVWAWIGTGFMMVTFGALFANTLTARISSLAGQLYFLLHDWLQIVK